MFDTALILIDDLARPVLIIPEDLPKGDAFLNIVAGGFDVGVGGKTFGKIRDMQDESLALLSLQEKIGMATYKGEKATDELPETIQYVAQVTDTRF